MKRFLLHILYTFIPFIFCVLIINNYIPNLLKNNPVKPTYDLVMKSKEPINIKTLIYALVIAIFIPLICVTSSFAQFGTSSFNLSSVFKSKIKKRFCVYANFWIVKNSDVNNFAF